MSVHQHNDGRWIVVYKDANGKRHDKSFGRGEDAQLEAEAFDRAMKTRQVQTTPAERTDMGITLESVIGLYCQHLSASGKTQRHIQDDAVCGAYHPLHQSSSRNSQPHNKEIAECRDHQQVLLLLAGYFQFCHQAWVYSGISHEILDKAEGAAQKVPAHP